MYRIKISATVVIFVLGLVFASASKAGHFTPKKFKMKQFRMGTFGSVCKHNRTKFKILNRGRSFGRSFKRSSIGSKFRGVEARAKKKFMSKSRKMNLAQRCRIYGATERYRPGKETYNNSSFAQGRLNRKYMNSVQVRSVNLW